jgi:hypothetical protein
VEEFLTNIRPTVFGLIGFIISYYTYRNSKKQWSKKAPRELTHPLTRIILGGFVFAIISFVISMFLTTSLTYAIINTVIMVVIFLLYVSKVIMDVKKFHSKR